jgi:hypothetical protein
MKRAQNGNFVFYRLGLAREWFTSLPHAQVARKQHIRAYTSGALPDTASVIDEVTLAPMSRKAQVLALLRGDDVIASRKTVVGPWEPPVVLVTQFPHPQERERFGFADLRQLEDHVRGELESLGLWFPALEDELLPRLVDRLAEGLGAEMRLVLGPQISG